MAEWANHEGVTRRAHSDVLPEASAAAAAAAAARSMPMLASEQRHSRCGCAWSSLLTPSPLSPSQNAPLTQSLQSSQPCAQHGAARPLPPSAADNAADDAAAPAQAVVLGLGSCIGNKAGPWSASQHIRDKHTAIKNKYIKNWLGTSVSEFFSEVADGMEGMDRQGTNGYSLPAAPASPPPPTPLTHQ